MMSVQITDGDCSTISNDTGIATKAVDRASGKTARDPYTKDAALVTKNLPVVRSRRCRIDCQIQLLAVPRNVVTDRPTPPPRQPVTVGDDRDTKLRVTHQHPQRKPAGSALTFALLRGHCEH